MDAAGVSNVPQAAATHQDVGLAADAAGSPGPQDDEVGHPQAVAGAEAAAAGAAAADSGAAAAVVAVGEDPHHWLNEPIEAAAAGAAAAVSGAEAAEEKPADAAHHSLGMPTDSQDLIVAPCMEDTDAQVASGFTGTSAGPGGTKGSGGGCTGTGRESETWA
jgi:hypothetical protein